MSVHGAEFRCVPATGVTALRDSGRGIVARPKLLTLACLCTGFGWTGLEWTPGANAQAAAPPAASEEVTVTAQKRQQKLQNVPLAVTALGARSLAALGRRDLTALPGLVPGLQVQGFGPTVTIFNIRGVSQNDYTDSQEAPVAFYNDDVYISATGAINGMTYDLQRIEILRGPQGTLFGRNATGGLVQTISAPPTDHFSAYEAATFGSYGQLATEGAVSGAITERLRGRISFTSDNHGGYIQNDAGPDLGAKNFYGVRVQLAGDLTDADRFNVKFESLVNNNEHSAGAYSFASAAPNADGLGQIFGKTQNPFGTCPGCSAFGYANPSDTPFVNAETGPDLFDKKFWSVTGHYSHDFGSFSLTAISNFQRLRKAYKEDTDASPVDVLQYLTYQNLYQASQEVRLNGTAGRLTWTAGLYGIKIHTDNSYYEDFLTFDSRNRYGGKLDTESLAIFEQAEYRLADTLTLTLGARYSNDWKRYDYAHATNGVTDFVFSPGVNGNLARRNDGDYSGKIGLSYKPTANVLYYAGINRGTKSGGFSTPVAGPFNPDTMAFKPEKLTDYEAGVKLTLFNQTSHLNGAAFYYDYRDYQALYTSPTTVFVANNNATIKGVEAEFNTQPVRGVYLQAFGTFLDGRVSGVRLPSGRVANNRMPQSPRLSLGGLASYSVPVRSGKLTLQTDWKYDSEQYFSSYNAPDDLEPDHLVGNVRLSYQFGGERRWEFAFFANNVTDKRYRVYNGDAASSFGFTQETFMPPRWFGGTVTLRLGGA